MSYALIISQGNQQTCYPVDPTDTQPVLIGRAVHCDIVLTDEFIDPEHLRLSLDSEGHIQIEDLDTVNGSLFGKKNLRFPVRCETGAKIILGETSISLVDAQSSMAPAKKYDAVHKASRTFQSWIWMFFATAIAFAGLLLENYFISSKRVSTETLTENTIMLGVIILGWSAVAAIISMVFRQKLFFKLHWIFVCVFLAASWLATVVSDLIKFNLDSSTANTLIDIGFMVVFCTFFCYCVMSLMFQWHKTKRVIIAGLLVIGPVVVIAGMPLISEERDFWSSSANPARTSLPPALLFRAPVTVEDHLVKVEALFAQVDEQVMDTSLPQNNDAPLDVPDTYSLKD